MSEMIEVPKELAEKIYKLIESVKVDGKLRKGANEVTKSIEKSEAKLVIIASDVQPQEIIMHLPVISKEHQIPYVHVPSRAELGASASLPVATAAIAIVNTGDAMKAFSDVIKSLELLKKGSEPAKPKVEEKPVEKKEEPKVEQKPKEEKPAEKPREEAKPKEETKPEPKAEVKKEEAKVEEKPTEEKPKEEPKAEEPKTEEKPAEEAKPKEEKKEQPSAEKKANVEDK